MSALSFRRFLPKRHTLVLSAAVLTVTGVIAVVTPPSPVGAAGAYSIPPASGQLLASNCYQCHGTDGQSGAIDQLAGDSATDMYSKLKDQQTKNSIMGAQARGYTDAQLQAIAKYFSTIVKK